MPRHDDLFASERPVRSDFALGDVELERVYARRRRVTVAVFLCVIGGAAYGVWGHGGSASGGDVPTVRAEGPYKQKPADPGGIGIPHQDVQVYDQLDSKKDGAAQVEHLLPLPETPREAAPAPVAPPQPVSPADAVAPPPASAPVSLTPPAAPISSASAAGPPPSSVPMTETLDTAMGVAPAPAPVTTTVAAAPTAKPPSVPSPAAAKPAPKAPLAPKPEALTIEQILKRTGSAPAASSVPASGGGRYAVQLASVPDQSHAQSMMQSMQTRFAADLGAASLRLERADLGAKGVYYRIRSQSLSEAEANRICSALKAKNAGCILVRH